MCFRKRNQPPKILSDVKIENPLLLEEMPSSLIELRALEAVLIDRLVSLHYIIEETKQNVGSAFREGSTDQARSLIAKKTVLLDKKFILEKKLQKVQAKLQTLH